MSQGYFGRLGAPTGAPGAGRWLVIDAMLDAGEKAR
jgi:hypothetical protein